jgi:hypothetical protein
MNSHTPRLDRAEMERLLLKQKHWGDVFDDARREFEASEPADMARKSLWLAEQDIALAMIREASKDLRKLIESASGRVTSNPAV